MHSPILLPPNVPVTKPQLLRGQVLFRFFTPEQHLLTSQTLGSWRQGRFRSPGECAQSARHGGRKAHPRHPLSATAGEGTHPVSNRDAAPSGGRPRLPS
jgi:hypothetical protein